MSIYALADDQHSGLKAFVWAVADLLVAVVFLMLVIGITTLTLSVVNHIALLGGGKIVLDLQTILQEIRKNPLQADYFWIYFLFFSTLVPTAVHALIASFSVLVWIPRSLLKNWTRGWKDNQSEYDFPKFFGVWAYGTLILPVTLLAVAGIGVVAYHLFVDWGGGVFLGGLLLDAMEWIDQSIRAVLFS